jgi:hypothetical protein
VSQKLPSPKIITIATAEAFEDVVRNSQLSVDEDGWRWREELSNGGPPLLDDFVKHWTNSLGEQSGAEQVLQALPHLVEENPVQTEVALKGVVFVKDLKTFKESLKESDVAGPLVDWGDSPTVKF